MAADEIRADYDQLAQIARRFAEASEASAEQSQRLRQRMDALRASWRGRAAAAFYAEMEGDLLPALTRLTEALAAAQRTTAQISETLRAAEAEAAALFNGAGEGATGGGAEAPAEASSAPALPTPVPTDELFSESTYDALVGSQFQGANSEQLRGAMNVLLGEPSASERDAALAQIAAARGMSVEEVRAHYDRYLDLRAEQERIGALRGQSPVKPDLYPWQQDFMGSTAQLRFGKMVGDALGVDPVFGAMLSPTGGMVGPGRNAVHLDDDSPVGYHGIVHDAAGYLYNYHGKGPGYDYLGREGRDTSDAFTGQESGIRYWNEKLGAGGWQRELSEAAGSGMGKWVDASEWIGERRRDLSEGWQDTKEWFDDLFDF